MKMIRAILRQERTEFGKRIRSSYERKEIVLKRMDMKEYKPRTDCISNTLTGVTKDNMLIEIADDEVQDIPISERIDILPPLK